MRPAQKRLRLLLGILPAVVVLNFSATAALADKPATTLGIKESQFTINGRSTFLLGISYYAGLSANDAALRQDLDDIQRQGFNWIRVWGTWECAGEDVSAVDRRGQARQFYLERLKRLVSECDRRGLIVDVTLTRGKPAGDRQPIGRLPDFESHQRAVGTIVTALKGHRNWYLDLANERDVRDARFVPVAELKTLRDQVKRLDSARLVTASFGGHDLDERDVREALLTAELDFLSPHRPRDAKSPSQTEARTTGCLDLMRKIGRTVPVHLQEPFRRGYTAWNPVAEDFLTDLRGAVAGGAAGWCFHNGSERTTRDHLPARSFDLRQKRLFEQLDAEEQKVVNAVAGAVRNRSHAVP